MSTRSLTSVVLPSLLVLLFAAVASNASVARAQSGPAITATTASAPESYVVAGTGFAPGAQLRVLGVTCGPLPCGAGGGGRHSLRPMPVGGSR